MNEEKALTVAGADVGDSTPVVNARERTPEMIGAEIRMYLDTGRRITLLCGIEIGRRLTEAKEMLHHGEWLPWLERETEFSTSSAQRYMKVFEEYGAAQLGLFGPETNSPTLGNLSISNALRLLAIPEEERENFAQEHDVENMTARDLDALIKERTAEAERKAQRWEEQAGSYASQVNDLQNDLKDTRDAQWKAESARAEAEKARAEAEKQLLRIRQELEEIEARPQETVYERDEQAIAEAVQAERVRQENDRAEAIAKAANDAADAERAKYSAAEKDYKKSIRELKDQIKKAEEEKAEAGKRLEELAKKADASERSGQETEQLRRQIDTLQKQLTLSAPEVKEFEAAFDRAQDELVHMNDALHKIGNEELREKLRKACAAMLDGFRERVQE